MNLSIWEMADLEYMKYTFVDAEDLKNETTSCKYKPDLFDYIDSIGKIDFVDDEYSQIEAMRGHSHREHEHSCHDESDNQDIEKSQSSSSN